MKKGLTLTQTDIICFAIQNLEKRVAEGDKLIKEATDLKFKKMLREGYEEMFFKFRKLLELYKLQTGVDYGMEYDFDFMKEE